MSAGQSSPAKVYSSAYRWMRDLVGADVVEKTIPKRNPRIVCVNRPLHAGTSFDSCTYLRCRTVDGDILGSTHSLARKSRRIYLRKDIE